MIKEEREKARRETLKAFNPDENGLKTHGIFGLPFSPEESQIVLLPVPWEVTVSYGEGTAHGPDAIMKASQQIDLYDPIYPEGWKAGIAMEHTLQHFMEAGHAIRSQAMLYMHEISSGEELSPQAKHILERVNTLSQEMNQAVYNHSKELLEQGKFVGLIGGEHSVPLGYMQALAERHPGYAILQIDAHADLRIAYEGFTYSHASIMYNAMQTESIGKLVQVGIRDFCWQEYEVAQQAAERIKMYTDHEIKKALFSGTNWQTLANNIIAQLPNEVYISFDIDGLQPWLCPNTGTPVAGGLLLEEAFYLLERVVESGKKIIGFDLCEVSPGEDEWDGNVGCRVLYKLCLLAAKSNNMSI